MSGELDTIDEGRVREAMRADRPDPDAFRAEVDRKLCERQQMEDALGEDSIDMRAASPWMRMVASVAPVSAAAKASPIGKSVLGTLALPAIGLVLMFATFFSGVRRVGSNASASEVTERKMRRALSDWRAQHRWKYYLAYFAVVALMFFDISLALTVLICGYMVSMGCYVAFLASRGLAERKWIAGLCVGALMPLFLSSYLIATWVPGHDAQLLDARWITVVGAVGLMVCLLIAGGLKPALVLGVVIVPWSVAFGYLAATPAVPSFAQMVARVEAFDSAPYRSPSWVAFATVAARTVERGAAPDWTKVRAVFDRHFVDERGHVDDFVAHHALRIGMLDAPRLEKLLATLDSQQRDQLVSPAMLGQPLPLTRGAWTLRLLAPLDAFDSAERDVLESRLLASWPAEREFHELETMLSVVELLEVINRPIDVDAYRARVFGALEVRQVRGRGFLRRTGGFDTVSPGEPTYADEGTTLAAVRLMTLFGLPSGVEMERVRSFLFYKAKPKVPFFPRNDNNWISGVALEVYDAEFPREHTLFGWILSERLLIGSVLLMGLMIIAVLRAPREVA